ncbi:MAG: ABC transporter substrate-binding protein [Ilumatobacteraceae bacterium]
MAEQAKKIWVPKNSVNRRQFIVGSSAAATALTLAACSDDKKTTSNTDAPGTTTGGGGDTTLPPVKSGGILRVGTLGGANDLMDGQQIISKADIVRTVTGWESLLNFDPDYNVVNTYGLAEEVEAVAADNYIIHLRQGVLFHDGKEMTADDLVYSFQRLLDPDLAVFGGSALRPILSFDGVTKLDDYTVEVQLLQLVSNFTEGLCAYTSCVVPVGYNRFDGDPSTQIGTSAYKLEEFEVGVQSIHSRFADHWRGGASFDEVHIIDFADGDAMINALIADQIDVAGDIPATAVETLESSGFGVLNSAGGGWLTIFMAVDIAPFDDVRVRQAMRLMVDRQQMVDQVLAGFGSIANDLYSPLDSAYIGDELPQRDQDIPAAMALLEEAGLAGMEVDLLAPNDTAGLPELIQAFSTMAADAGITVNAVVMDGSYWGDEYLKRPFGVDYWGTRNFLAQVAASSLPTAPYPDDHWPNGTLDGPQVRPESTFLADYNAAVAEVDPVARKVITDKMQTELYEEGGLIIPFFSNQLDGFNTRVVGLVERANTLNLDHYGRGWQDLSFAAD